MSKVVPSDRHQYRELGEVLIDLIQTEGPVIFRGLVGEKAGALKRTPVFVRSLLSEAKNKASALTHEIAQCGVRPVAQKQVRRALSQVEQAKSLINEFPNKAQQTVTEIIDYYRALPNTVERAEYMASWILSAGSFVGGLGLGLRVPRYDLNLALKGNRKDQIVLHTFPLFMVQLGLDWVDQLLQLAQSTHQLSPHDIRRVQGLRRVFGSFQGGFSTGALTRDWTRAQLPKFGKKSPSIKKVDLRQDAYKLAESLFATLSRPTDSRAKSRDDAQNDKTHKDKTNKEETS